MRIKRPNHPKQRNATGRRRLAGVLGLLAIVPVGLALGLFSALTQPQDSLAQSTRSSEAPAGMFVSGAESVRINDRRALPGMPIFTGDVVTTDASGRALLTFMDEATLYLAGNTQVQVQQIVAATESRSRVLVLAFEQGVGRMVAGDQDRPELALIRGGGGGATVIEGGTLDMVSSNNRLVTVMRSGKSSCRAANATQLAMTEKLRACILSGGSVRPSMLSAGMKRVIDERLSIPPSAASLSLAGASAPVTDYAVNALDLEERENATLPPVVEPESADGQTQSLLLQQLSSDSSVDGAQ